MSILGFKNRKIYYDFTIIGAVIVTDILPQPFRPLFSATLKKKELGAQKWAGGNVALTGPPAFRRPPAPTARCHNEEGSRMKSTPTKSLPPPKNI